MAGSNYRIEVQGVAETMRTLAKFDPELRKAVVKDMKAAARPLEAAARANIPAAPLSNWGNWPTGRGTYDPSQVKKGIKVAFRSGGVKGFDKTTFPLLTLRQTNAQGAIYEMAGRKFPGRKSEGKARGRAMVQKLDSFGSASRTLWPAVERGLPAVEKNLRDVIDSISKEINAEILRRA